MKLFRNFFFSSNIVALVFLIGCAQPQPVQAPRVYYPTLEFMAMKGSTLSRDSSILTIAPMQTDIGNFASSLEISLAQKYRIISSVSNKRATTSVQEGNTTTTRNDVTSTKATHVVRISYSGVKEVDQYYATTFNAQLVRVADGAIDGVIRIHPNSYSLFSQSYHANKAFNEVIQTMP